MMRRLIAKAIIQTILTVLLCHCLGLYMVIRLDSLLFFFLEGFNWKHYKILAASQDKPVSLGFPSSLPRRNTLIIKVREKSNAY